MSLPPKLCTRPRFHWFERGKCCTMIFSSSVITYADTHSKMCMSAISFTTWQPELTRSLTGFIFHGCPGNIIMLTRLLGLLLPFTPFSLRIPVWLFIPPSFYWDFLTCFNRFSVPIRCGRTSRCGSLPTVSAYFVPLSGFFGPVSRCFHLSSFRHFSLVCLPIQVGSIFSD